MAPHARAGPMDPPPPTPPAPPAGPVEGLGAAHSRRSAQVALATFLAVLLGLVAFRGYGNRVGARPTEAVPGPAGVDVNRADPAELEQVPGLGPKLARAVADHRRERGPFRSVDDLRGVPGIGPATLEKVRPFVRVEEPGPALLRSPDPSPPGAERPPPPAPAPKPTAARPLTRKLQPGDPPVNVNAATADELQAIPGVGPVTAQKIVAARAATPFRSADDLRRVRGIGPKTLETMRPFVVVK